MSNRRPLTVAERETIYDGKLSGERLIDLARECQCSYSCARKWWRVGRKHGRDALRQQRQLPASGALSRFEPIVAERALYWKRLHSKRGATRILADMEKDSRLESVRLPKKSALAAFFREVCPELLQQRKSRSKPPPRPTHVHALWEVDSKENIRLADGTIATALDVREPLACCFLGSFAHEVQTEKAWRKLDLREIQADLRLVFAEFGLPVAIQTDRESVYGKPPEDIFPTLFTSWLVGLGITHQFIRPGQSTDQAHVERGHKTLFDWIEEPQPLANLVTLQSALDEARFMHNCVLPSQAGDCQGRPPQEVHPEVKIPLRPYSPDAELALFDLRRVDQFLSRFAWPHKVSQAGQTKVGSHLYYIGVTYAGQVVDVRFVPKDRHLTFHNAKNGHLLRRQPIKALTVATITGLEVPPPPTGEPTQLSFPW
jgi:transposase InsO family protein